MTSEKRPVEPYVVPVSGDEMGAYERMRIRREHADERAPEYEAAH